MASDAEVVRDMADQRQPVQIKMPVPLYRALKVEAAKTGATMSLIIVQLLRERYGLTTEDAVEAA